MFEERERKRERGRERERENTDNYTKEMNNKEIEGGRECVCVWGGGGGERPYRIFHDPIDELTIRLRVRVHRLQGNSIGIPRLAGFVINLAKEHSKRAKINHYLSS